jgi:deferrochelatase/peroxidase EfeB
VAALNRSNIQAVILERYQTPISRHLLFSLGEKSAARAFLADWLPKVTHAAADLSPGREPMLNIAVTWRGLVKLGAFDAIGGVGPAEDAFPHDFIDLPDEVGLRAYGVSAAGNWWNKRFKTDAIDLTIHLYCVSDAVLESTTADVRASAQMHGVTELIATKTGQPITGKAFAGRQLHFGYMDGISHPPVNWDDLPDRPDLMPRGKFLLGEWLEDAQAFPRHPPWIDITRDGSYTAFVWIYQDVAAFKKFLREQGPRVAPHFPQADAEEWLAAKLMGRWRDGTPLVLSPDRRDPALVMANGFSYGDDMKGFRCPFEAHVRVVNSRDQPLNAANAGMFPQGFPRVLRRGSPYGPQLEGDEDDQQDRGTVGMFLCASINQQFYPLTRWIGKTDFSDVTENHGQDPLIGGRSVPGAKTTFRIPTPNGPIQVGGLVDFVRIQGVAIGLLPSIASLRNLSAPVPG